MKKIKDGTILIVSEGTGINSAVYMPNGDMIPYVYKAEWSCAVGELAVAVLHIHKARIRAKGRIRDITSLGDKSRQIALSPKITIKELILKANDMHYGGVKIEFKNKETT